MDDSTTSDFVPSWAYMSTDSEKPSALVLLTRVWLILTVYGFMAIIKELLVGSEKVWFVEMESFLRGKSQFISVKN